MLRIRLPLWIRKRFQSSGEEFGLGLKERVEGIRGKKGLLKKSRCPERRIVVLHTNATFAAFLCVCVGLVLGCLIGFWYRGLNGGGGGSEVQTVKEKMVPVVQEVAKLSPPKTPPEKRPLVPPARVESREPVVVSKPPVTSGSVSQPSGLDSLAAETQALKKRVQQMK